MLDIPLITLKFLILSFLTAKRQSIHNRNALRNTLNQSFDFVVVGAGPGGCAVAGRLSENPNFTVLLLEAGGVSDALYFDIRPTVFTSVARPDLSVSFHNEPAANVGNAGKAQQTSRIDLLMGRSIGGTPLTYIRGNSRDYNKWAQNYGAFGWSFNEVLPFFLRSENNTDMKIVENNPGYHGIGGPIQISTPEEPRLFKILENVYNRMGLQSVDVNGRNQTGVMFVQQYINTQGFRANAYNYVDPNPNPNNLHIATRALVTRVLFRGKTAIGVEFERNNIPFRVYARKEVILCAGSYNTPQLLMLSGVGIRSHLQSFGIKLITELPVGNNLADIPIVHYYASITEPSLTLSPRQLSLQELNQFYFNQSGSLVTGISYLAAYSSTSSITEIDYPNSLTWFMIEANGDILRFATSLVRVNSKGTVRLQSSSPYIPPKINTNLLSDPRDFRDLLELTKSVFKLLETTVIARYTRLTTFSSLGCPDCPGQYLYQCNQGLECLIRNYLQTYSLPVGTCRMGALHRVDVVVGPNLKVKNLNNLRICDASISPEHPNSNTYSMANMIGEKCAQNIKDEINHKKVAG